MEDMTGMPFPGCVPELTDGVVRLRAHRPEDAERIVEQSTDPESMRWTTVPRPYGLDDARDFLAEIERELVAPPTACGAGRSRMPRTPRARYLGTIDLRPRRRRRRRDGVRPAPEGRGRGSWPARCGWPPAGGSARAATRVHWLAVRGNFASWRVAWSCGFTHHGTIPQSHPDPDDPAGTGARRVARQPRRRRRHGAPHAVGGRRRCSSAEEGDGIRLRPWRDDDVDRARAPRPARPLHAGAGGARRRHLPRVADRSGASRCRSARVLSWCVADTTTDAALGEVLVFVTEGTLDDDTAELGYQVVPSAPRPRRGDAPARGRCVAHAFAPRAAGGLGMRRLVAQTAEDNAASNTVLDRLGFTIWGRETAADVLPDGRAVDALHWELLRD